MSLRAFIRTFWCICSVSVLVCLKTLKDELWSVVFVEFNDVSNGNSACGDFGISVLDCPTGEGNLLFLINSFFDVFVFLASKFNQIFPFAFSREETGLLRQFYT